jgi:hypothetical protein
MEFEGHEMTFQEAERRYADLKRQLEADQISPKEFDAQRRQLMIQDAEGRWWAKSRETGDWHYHDGSAWVPGTPPSYQLPPQTNLPSSAPALDPDGQKWRRGRTFWIWVAGLFGVVALLGVGIVLWLLLPGIQGASKVAQKAVGTPKPAPGYQLAKDDSGNLSVEVPSAWEIETGEKSEGASDASWSSFAGVSIGSSITASANLGAWYDVDAAGVPGVYMVASKELAQKYTDDELVTQGPHDYSSGCTPGEAQNFDRSSYSGKIQAWNCDASGSRRANTLLTASASPQGRECVVVLQVLAYSEADREVAQHILNTFEADCERI